MIKYKYDMWGRFLIVLAFGGYLITELNFLAVAAILFAIEMVAKERAKNF